MNDPENVDRTLPWSSSRSESDHHRTLDTVNAPSNVHGQAQNYRSSNRFFSRPYSAKTVFFYKENDIYFAGVRVPISKARYRTIESLLDDLNSNISMPFGVRCLKTPRGKTTIRSIDQLQHNGRYIASSSKAPRPLNLSMVKKIQQSRQANRVNAPNFYRKKLFDQQKQNEGENEKRPLKLSLLPATGKQILFVLNGKPSRIYRAVLNPLRQLTMESLLEEISEGLQIAVFKLYTYTGKRIVSINEIFLLDEARLLAVPRNERPILQKSRFSMRTPLLPPILRTRMSGIAKQAAQPERIIYRDNSIERPQRPINKSKKNSLSSMAMFSRRESIESKCESMKKMQKKEKETHFEENEEEEKRGVRSKEEEGNMWEDEMKVKEEGQFVETEEKQTSQDDKDKLGNSSAEGDIRTSLTSINSSEDIVKLNDEEKTKQQAAKKIQAFYRGYRIRKELKKRTKEPRNFLDNNGSENDDETKLRTKAAITVQAYWRGYYTRQKLKQQKATPISEGEQMEWEANTATTESIDSVVGCAPKLEVETPIEQISDNDPKSISFSKTANFRDNSNDHSQLDGTTKRMTYTVSVITGNRWAADTDLNLFIILHGTLNKSGKHLLRQDYINWLQTREPKFRQNRMDSFHIETMELGLLQKIVIGHDHIGYGAGIYIERILITENTADGRQYLFQCTKWLDSGQVDGKIQRTLKTMAYFYIAAIPEDTKITNGRWELILHSGKQDGDGATTSNLNIIGYGSQGSSMTTKIYDSRMAKAPSTSLIQVDFGKIGDLLKVRIEIDGNGQMPDYYLDYVELKDLDTEERMVSYVRKWMRMSSDEKNAQPFREFPVFRAAFEPLNVFSYEGKIKLTSRKHQYLKEAVGYVQLLGEFGETGHFPVNLTYAAKTKEVSFKTEAVSIGRIRSSRLYIKTNDIGEELYEGMQMLQNIYDRRNITDVAIGSSWIADKITVRESHHAPYRFVMELSRVKNKEKADEELNEEVNERKECIFKELLLSGMEGLSTKVRKKKALPRKKSQWILLMTIGEQSTLVPKVTLCTDGINAEMAIVDTTPKDMIITFQQKTADIPSVRKIRISIDDSERLNYIPPDGITTTSQNIVEVQKMRLYDSANGDELRFPSANTVLTSESVYEFPAVWPDIPPSTNIVYIITVKSGESSANFDAYLTLTGTKGDTGFRKLTNEESNPFEEEKISTFEVEAVSIGDAVKAEIALRSVNQNLRWVCEQLQVLDSDSKLFYLFKFKKMFTENRKSQQVNVLQLTDALSSV